MKEVLLRIKKTGRIYIKLLFSLCKLKQLLIPGIYTLKLSSLSKEKVILFPRYLIVINRTKSNRIIDCKSNTEIEVVYCNKIMYFVSDFVISFYGNDRQRVLNIKKNIGAIEYPKTIFHEISVTENYTITNKVIGDTNYNKTRMNIVACETLKCATNSADITKPNNCILNDAKYPSIRYSVQHGDLQWCNMVWTDDNHYYVIDFDTIGIYPTFYDFFILMISTKGAIKEYYYGKYDKEIYDYMKRHSIDDSIESFKDECLAAAVMVAYEWTNIDIKIRKDIPANYVLTREALAFLELSRRSKGQKDD